MGFFSAVRALFGGCFKHQDGDAEEKLPASRPVSAPPASSRGSVSAASVASIASGPSEFTEEARKAAYLTPPKAYWLGAMVAEREYNRAINQKPNYYYMGALEAGRRYDEAMKPRHDLEWLCRQKPEYTSEA